MMGKRRFGRVRALTSGRFQARYPGPDGVDRPAPETSASKTDAEVWLTLKEAEILNGDWINPDDGEVSLIEYARTWIEERPGLRPKTVDGCSYLLRKHLTPVLGPMPIADIKPGHVRRWRKQLLDKGVSAVTVAKAYRLLKAILNTAGEDLPDQGNGVVRDDEGDGQRHCGIQPVPPPVARMIAPATATPAAAAASAMVSSRTAATDRSPSPASPSSPSYWCTAESNCVVFAFAALRASGRWRFLGPQATALCQASSIAGLGLGSRFGFVSQRSGWCAGPATTRRRRRSRRGRNRRRPG